MTKKEDKKELSDLELAVIKSTKLCKLKKMLETAGLPIPDNTEETIKTNLDIF